MTTVAFVLVSWRPDAPAGMERAVAALATGLHAAGQHAVIITAEQAAPSHYAGVPVAALRSLTVPDPCTDDELRAAIDGAGNRLTDELLAIFAEHGVAAAVYVDALWGLGRAMPTDGQVRRILAVHVVGHDIDLAAALPRAEQIIAPSPTVLRQAADRGYQSSRWKLIPNPLLADPTPPSMTRRRWLRRHGPIRVLARLGPEKGVADLLAAVVGARVTRPVEIALAAAGFENQAGDQQRLFDTCQQLADRSGVTIGPGLPWHRVPAWLAAAALVIVPSTAETFGLVALEAMAGGTPVVAFDVDHLPALIADGGLIVPPTEGFLGLWRAAGTLLDDPVSYEHTARAGYYQSRDYRPAHIADLLVKVVS